MFGQLIYFKLRAQMQLANEAELKTNNYVGFKYYQPYKQLLLNKINIFFINIKSLCTNYNSRTPQPSTKYEVE